MVSLGNIEDIELDYDKIRIETYDRDKNATLIKGVFTHIVSTNGHNQAFIILKGFCEYIRNILDIDVIDITSEFFQILPESAKKQILKRQMELRLKNTGYTLIQIEELLNRYGVALI